MKYLVIGLLFLLSANLIASEDAFCGKLINVRGGIEGDLGDVSSLSLFDRNKKDKEETPYNERFLNVTDFDVIKIVAFSTELHLGTFISEDEKIKAENVELCVNNFETYVRLGGDRKEQYARNVKNLSVKKDGELLVEGKTKEILTKVSSTVIEISYWFEDGGESFEPRGAEKDLWKYDEDESAYIYENKEKIRIYQLPHRHSSGDFSFSISKGLEMTLDYSYGDADGGACASTNLHQQNDLLLELDYELEISGGDYASGYWGIEGYVNLRVISPYKLMRSAYDNE